MSLTIPTNRQAQLDTLSKIESDLATGASSVDLTCQRAALLDALGRTDDARHGYLDALAAAPDHADTLNGLGAQLYRTGYHSAARTTYTQAVRCHPTEPIGHVNLANLLLEDGDLPAARRHYELALQIAPDFPEAHQGLGNVLMVCGELAEAQHHWRLGYRDRVMNVWPHRGPGEPIRVLMLTSVANGNIPVRAILDDRVFAVTTVAMEFYTPEHVLPAHDLVLNAIGDADLCGTALEAAVDLLVDGTAAPVINQPSAVLRTGRQSNARRLGQIPGVVTPRCTLLRKTPLAGTCGSRILADHGFTFPVLLRTPGFHTGQHFVRVDSPRDLPSAVAALPGDVVLAIEFLDARGTDGKSRKGRVMIVDGQLYPLHWAISPNWKVHYFTAEMADCKQHRLEESRFLSDMSAFLGPLAAAALRSVVQRLDLDYGGIDFALGPDGQVLLFEANATMAIVPPPSETLWDYRRSAMDRALLAAKGMLMVRGRATQRALHQPAEGPAHHGASRHGPASARASGRAGGG